MLIVEKLENKEKYKGKKEIPTLIPLPKGNLFTYWWIPYKFFFSLCIYVYIFNIIENKMTISVMPYFFTWQYIVSSYSSKFAVTIINIPSYQSII